LIKSEPQLKDNHISCRWWAITFCRIYGIMVFNWGRCKKRDLPRCRFWLAPKKTASCISEVLIQLS